MIGVHCPYHVGALRPPFKPVPRCFRRIPVVMTVIRWPLQSTLIRVLWLSIKPLRPCPSVVPRSLLDGLGVNEWVSQSLLIQPPERRLLPALPCVFFLRLPVRVQGVNRHSGESRVLCLIRIIARSHHFWWAQSASEVLFTLLLLILLLNVPIFRRLSRLRTALMLLLLELPGKPRYWVCSVIILSNYIWI